MEQNNGVLLGQRYTDYISGVLPYEERNPDGNWEQYLPSGEWQGNKSADTMACVSFSALNSLETQYKFYTGQEKNFSDRFTATMSGTTRQGNYLWKVADSIRHDGVVEEQDYPAPENYTWDAYYTAVPIEIINKAKLFLHSWKVEYEWIDISKDSLIYHLKHAPIQVVFPNHAVLGFYSTQQVIKYFDSYAPYIKERESITHAMKIVLTKIGETLDMLKLIKESEFASDIYVVSGSKRFHILDPDSFLRGIDSLWPTWTGVVVEDPRQYQYGGALFIAKPDDKIK